VRAPWLRKHAGVSCPAPSDPIFRWIRPGDASALRAFHERLSEDTVRNRFFGPHRELSVQEARRFCSLRPGFEAACVATDADDHILAVGRYSRVGVGDSAEVAFVVEDRYQHRGIGTSLLTLLVRLAWDDGIRRLVADTLSTNSAMLGIFLHTPAAVTVLTTRRDGGVVHLVMTLTEPPRTARLSLLPDLDHVLEAVGR
jgi:RimJ/RimL family protein N-acetyltransferase